MKIRTYVIVSTMKAIISKKKNEIKDWFKKMITNITLDKLPGEIRKQAVLKYYPEKKKTSLTKK